VEGANGSLDRVPAPPPVRPGDFFTARDSGRRVQRMSNSQIVSPLDRRRAGVLLHPTSLPGTPGAGDLGANAYRFVDFLVASGFTVWQTLPLTPTHADLSPYGSRSVFAGNERMISLERLVEAGWLAPDSGPAGGEIPEAHRIRRLQEAHEGFRRHASAEVREAYASFIVRHQYWLEDYALYQACRRLHDGAPWWEWPEDVRDRHERALVRVRRDLAEAVELARFEQFVFFAQWGELRRYANGRGILVFGDIPLFVAHDSADVWAHREYFRLDPAGRPEVVAGVPPDYFSATGQRWGNPLYRWERMSADGFRWWEERLRAQLEQCDLLRIDHFRGLQAYWEIPDREPTAMHGRWVEAPGAELLGHLRRTFHRLPLVAEDLGVITPEVETLRDRFGLPGMKILQFAFGGGADNPYLPHNHRENSVVYTGTHDNNTSLGWFADLDEHTRAHVLDYLACDEQAMPAALCGAALASVARLAVLPMQDLLHLGAQERMNEPGRSSPRNWRWQFSWDQLGARASERYRHRLGLYGRL
jgi:4-alpha-glucanotransferase